MERIIAPDIPPVATCSRTLGMNRRRLVAAGVRNSLQSRVGLTAFPLVLALAGGQPNLHAAAGDLDPTFGIAGKVRTPIDPVSGESLYAVAIQPDGKIVSAGFGPSPTNGMALTRHNPDGTLDATFGTGGIVQATLLTFSGAHALVILPDGRLLTAGQASNGTLTRFALAQFTPTGALDPTFGPTADGRSMNAVTSYHTFATALTRLADGRIVAAGMADMPWSAIPRTALTTPPSGPPEPVWSSRILPAETISPTPS
jgi:uncharacterized delta-60 repeat protein